MGIVQRTIPDWCDDVEADIMNATLDKITQEISEEEDDDYMDYSPDGGKMGSGNMFENDDNGYADDDNKGVPDVNLDEIKQDLISEIMAVYDADKAKFMKVHEAEKAQMRDELKIVKEENAKLK